MADYVAGGVRVPEKGTARVWRYGGKATTVLSDDRHEKVATGFNGDLELARTCAEIWKAKGWSGWPRGPASFFHQEFDGPSIPWSVNLPLSRYFTGGWMEAFESGHQPGPLGYYDLKQAYLWAGRQPLPTRVRPFRYGDEHFVAVMDLNGHPTGVPRSFRRRRALVTREDVELYDLWGEILWGVSWRPEDTTRAPAETLEGIDYLPPKAEKLLTQSYWGRWAMVDRVQAEIWEDGERVKSWQLKNPSLNLLWSTLILHKVKRAVYRATLDSAVLVCVDAVLRSSPLETGSSPGDWQLKERIPEAGVVVEAPGVWSRAPAPADRSRWTRHAGHMSRARRRRTKPERKLASLHRQGFHPRTPADVRRTFEPGRGPLSAFEAPTLRLADLDRDPEVEAAELDRLELDALFGPA